MTLRYLEDSLCTVMIVVLMPSISTPTTSTVTIARHVYWPASDVFTLFIVVFNDKPLPLARTLPSGPSHSSMGCTTRFGISCTMQSRVCSLPVITVELTSVVTIGAESAEVKQQIDMYVLHKKQKIYCAKMNIFYYETIAECIGTSRSAVATPCIRIE